MSSVSSPFGAPGIYVTTQLAANTPPAQPTANPSVAGFIGEHYRGPAVAINCRSWSDFVKFFGGFPPATAPTLANPYLPYAVYEFFANGGQSAWVYRATASANAGASAGAILADSSATPNNTIQLTAGILGVAGNVGSWGNNIYYSVSANSSGAGRFNLNIYYGGSSASTLVEQWIDLSMSPTDPRYFLTVINSPIQGSLYVTATNLNDAHAAPYNSPAVTTQPVALSGGTNPGDPSVGDYEAMLTYGNQAPSFVAPFDYVSGVLNINLPGLPNTTGFSTTNVASIIDQGIQYCTTGRPFSFFVIDTASGQTPAGAVSYTDGLAPLSTNAAVYYPWLNAQNPASSSLQATILLPPGGFVLGQMASVDTTDGVWTAPAGLNTVFNNVVQAERILGGADLAALNTNNVNGLRTRPNGQVVIWGTRTLENGYASQFVPVQRFLNYLSASFVSLLEFAVFQPNDAVLWANITAVCTQFLDGLLSLGAFPSSQASNAYYVNCNATNNTQQSISQGVVNVQVGVALVYPAEFINLLISQFQPAGTTTVSAVTVI